MRHPMLYKLFFALLLATGSLALCFALLPTTQSYALAGSPKKPALTLNRSQGPLGIVLTLRGKDFPEGNANLSYIDATNVPGIFSPPSDTSVEVLPSGAFLTTNLVLPSSGPAGAWKIIVTDSQGNLTIIRYTVLAPRGQKTAGAPSLLLTLPNGTSSGATPTASGTSTPTGTTTTASPTTTPTGTASATPTVTSTATSAASNSITFSGSNWLPKGTAVKLALSAGSIALPLLEPPPVSNSDGEISGVFNMPSNLPFSSATIMATDASTGALRAQVPITITNGIVTFSSSATPTPVVNPTTSATSTPVATGNDTSVSAPNPFANMNAAIWGPVLLIAGGMLALAGLMLILFMLPWSRNHQHKSPHTRGGQF